MRGSWLDNVCRRHVLTIKIDRRRKMPATVLLRALGWETNDDIAEALAEVLKMTN